MRRVTTSLKLPESLEIKMHQQIVADGYGLRGKTRWIEEAIKEFLSNEDFPELVDIATEMENHTKIISLRINEELLKEVENSILKIREIYPMIEGVKSNLIRASIMQKLIRTSSPPGGN